MPTVAEELAAIKRGAAELISEGELKAKLAKGKPLIIKAGFDPTAPDLHLGHTVLLRKLRQFQDLGHKVVFLIGDATALVGDPSGQSKTRKLMTAEEVHANAATYYQQVQRILRVTPDVYQVRYNSEWFGGEYSAGQRQPFSLRELVEITSRYTVARLIERDDFQKRMKAGQEVSMLELLYPLMQGYDSVAIARRCGSCDVELGGTDQKFNLLVGRDLMRAYGMKEPQVVLTMPLLEGTDGVQKMSKSLGNQIGINDPPNELFGKVMSIPDTLIIKYFTLLTNVPEPQVAAYEHQLKTKAINPRDLKATLAETLVNQYHPGQAAQAREEFFKVFSRHEMPSQMKVRVAQVDAAGYVNLVDVLVAEGLAPSKREARRLLEQKAVKLSGRTVTDPTIRMNEPEGVLQVGSGRFLKLKRP